MVNVNYNKNLSGAGFPITFKEAGESKICRWQLVEC